MSSFDGKKNHRSLLGSSIVYICTTVDLSNNPLLPWARSISNAVVQLPHPIPSSPPVEPCGVSLFALTLFHLLSLSPSLHASTKTQNRDVFTSYDHKLHPLSQPLFLCHQSPAPLLPKPCSFPSPAEQFSATHSTSPKSISPLRIKSITEDETQILRMKYLFTPKGTVL